VRKIQDIRPPKKRLVKNQPEKENYLEQDEESIISVKSDIGLFTPLGTEQKDRVKLPKNALRGVTIFFLLAFILAAFFVFSLLRAKQSIAYEVGKLQKGFENLATAASSKDLLEIESSIDEIDKSTQKALVSLQSVGQDVYVLDLIAPRGEVSKSTKLTNSVRSAHTVTYAYKNLFQFDQSKNPASGGDWVSKVNQMLGNIKEKNSELGQKILYSSFITELSKSQLDFSSGEFEDDERQSIEKIQSLANLSSDFFHYFKTVPENVESVLGVDGTEKSYLILFQNNAEIRPGGGFIGSFARVDFKDGEMQKLDFEKNIYTLDKAFIASGKAPEPPLEYQDFITNWAMRDSNVFADFEESAKKVSWFYKEESGKDVDGVLAIDTTLFRRLLDIVGPIEMSEYNMTVTADNFLRDVQYQVEIGYFENKDNWSENQPKKILSDMLPIFMGKIFSDKNHQEKLLGELIKSIREKHFIAYFENSKIQDLMSGINMAGKIKNTSGDYLLVSDANIGGLKSSLNIEQNYQHNVMIDPQGNAEEELSIIKKHKGSYEWPDGENKNYVKVYLPLSADIRKVDFISGSNMQKSADGQAEYFKSSEFGKSVVGFWQNTLPGSESRSDVYYSRPEAARLEEEVATYNISLQKQPGAESFKYNLNLQYPDSWRPINVENYDENQHSITLNFTIKEDTSFSVKFVRSGT